MRAPSDPVARVRYYERLLWALSLGANYFGIALAIVYAYFFFQIYPEISGSERILMQVLPLILTFAVLGTVIGWLQSLRRVRPGMGWIIDGRPPTRDEVKALFAMPRWCASIGSMWWVIATVALLVDVVFVIRWEIPLAPLLRGLLALLLLSVVPWSLSYLFVERALRPVFAQALEHDVPLPKTMGIPARLFVAWFGTSGLPIIGVFLVLFGQDDAHRLRGVPSLFLICAAGTFAGAALAVFSGRAITDPLAKVRLAMRRIQEGDLNVRVPVSEAAELGELQIGVNRMVDGLRERERMREIFGHHVGHEVAQRAIDKEAVLGGETVEATAMFVDVIGSSSLAEQRPPDEVVGVLNAFFDAVVRCVVAEGGYVSKFEGDGALCIFGAPTQQDDHAERALRAARALRAELRSLAEGVDAAIGISTGQVVAGNVGTASRYEYTIIGDAVNEASRLTDEAKYRHTRVLASERTLERSSTEAANWGHSGNISLRGRARPTVAFEPGLE